MNEEEFGNLINEVGGDGNDQWKWTFRIVNAALAKNREACARVIDEAARNYRGASVQVAFPDDAKKRLAEVAEILEKQAAAIRSGKAGLPAAPIPMLLWCPLCHAQHVDRDEWATRENGHRKHLCDKCGHLWKPALVATVGVEALPL